ncbi:MAG TPA: Zn-dependent hydrolase [Steroidobacteraceae bacterium]|nr:Zn-dependent hydrolase [Steroidobacteraceae bacterium]
MSTAGLTVNFERLMGQLAKINSINRQPDGSCCRLALTDSDRRGRDLVVGWMREAGFEVRVDHIGNIIGVRPDGYGDGAVMTGSHIDTVATGGPYDGTLGVLAGLEVARTLEEAGIRTRRPIAVVVFTNEEGVRFQPDMMGSLVFAGGLPLPSALRAVGSDGTVVGEELERIGYAGTAPCGQIRPSAFVELHIEQGPVLDREGGVLGAVQDLQGISWQEITVYGASNHAGTTPMNLRHDAAHCLGKTIVFIRELTRRMGGTQVATVGSVQLIPNLVNVIAREVRFTVDLRNTDDKLLQSAEAELTHFVRGLEASEGVEVRARPLVRTEPVRFDEDVLRVIESVARDLGAPVRRMTSGAGHDAQMLSRVCPTAMIFVPSVGGVSHSPREHTAAEHLRLGVSALLHTLLQLADR